MLFETILFMINVFASYCMCFVLTYKGGKNPGDDSIYGEIGTYAPTFNSAKGGKDAPRRDQRREKDRSQQLCSWRTNKFGTDFKGEK